MDYKNKNCLKNLTKEGKLISMFYKGLYEDHFVSTDEFEVEDDDDMDMSSQSRTIRRSSSMSEDVKSSNKLQQEPLIKKQFIEEVEEIMNQYTIDHNILQKTSEKFLDYRNSLSNPSELSKMLRTMGTDLNYKNEAYICQKVSRQVLIEVTQNQI